MTCRMMTCRMWKTGLLVVTVGLVWSSLLALGAPGTGRLPWTDYQELLRWQVMAPGVQAPEREYVLLTSEPLTPEAEQELRELGLELVAAVEPFVVVRGPLTSFAGLGPDGEALPWAYLVLPSVPLSVSQAAPTWYGISIDQLRTHLGIDRLPQSLTGRGVTVGVLDGGFTGNIAQRLGHTRVQMLKLEWKDGRPTVVPGYAKDKHGEACAEGVLAVAPGVNLKLLSAPTTQDRRAFLQLIASGQIQVDVLTDSTFYPVPLDFGDGHGILAQLGDQVVERGVTYSYAIGNLGSRKDTDRSFYAAVFRDADGDGRHDFTSPATSPLDRNTLEITVAPWTRTKSVRLLVALTWDGWPWQVKPSGTWTCEDHVKVQDIDLFLFYKDGTRVVEVGKSLSNQLGPCYPEFRERYPGVTQVPPLETVYLELDRPGTYLVEVRNVTVSDHKLPGLFLRPVELKLFVYVYETELSLEHSSLAGSLLDLGGARRVLSVGAAGWTGSGWALMPFSSRGPTPDGRMKPELVAPSGYECSALSAERRYFGGTSASAPLVAGAAALLLEANRSLSPARLAELLLQGAAPLCSGLNPPCETGPGPCGHAWSHATGCGLLDVFGSHRLLRP